MARRRTEPTANPARGAALVVAAVVVGLLLLREGLDTSEAITATGDGGSETSDGASSDGSDGSDGGTDGDTTTTTVALRPPAEVPTIVLNDSGIAGAAGTYSDVLAAAGYQLTNPDGANEQDPSTISDTTVIYFAPGFEPEAVAAAAAIGAPDLAPVAMPATPPGPIAGASVVVVLGTDLASVTPTTGTTTTTAATN
jgi:hypothetical protein